MQGLIVYKSNYGSTKQYAEWLECKTGFKTLSVQKVQDQDLFSANCIVIGCPVFKFQPVLKNWILKKWLLIRNKNVILYTVSGAVPTHPKLMAGFSESFPEEMISRIRYVPLGGRMTFNHLKPVHKLMMKIGHRLEKNPEVKAEMLKDTDHVCREGILPILECIKTINKDE